MIGKLLGNRYEILEKIGGGGMALVYKAKCTLLNRFVAVKILRSEFTGDEEFIRRFRREAQSAASLSHPNIVSIYDVGCENDIHYIVMEYIKGKTLKELIRSNDRLEPEYSTNIAIQICSAIEHAHNNHIVHRDIKSHNIIIKEDGTVKVTDFGIARAVTSNTITNTGNVIGSVHYFSPEQARGGYTDEKSDLYSLGVVMYEMVTGRLPFEGDSPISVALKHIQEEPIRSKKLCDDIPSSLDDIINKCMSKDISKRYNSASDIIYDLKQSLVMPNGDFVKKESSVDQNTKVIDISDIVKTNSSEKGIISKKQENKDIKQNKKNNRIVLFAILAGLFLALVVFIGYTALNNIFNVKEVNVPNIINMSEQEAKERLKELGLIMEVQDRINDKTIPDGQVIKQDPKPGDTNKISNPVKVIISKGPRKVLVPSIINQSYDAVQLILESAGLEVGNVSQEYSSFPTGIVISQSIVQGILVDESTKIDYVISSGPEKFFMPSYIGYDIEEVKRDLIVKDLILGEISFENSSQYKENSVIAQSIKQNVEVTKKSIVDFVISKGPLEEKEKSAKLKITLPEGLENITVTVIKVQNDQSNKIYEGVHSSSENPLEISISGTGEVLYQVYFGDSLYDTIKHWF